VQAMPHRSRNVIRVATADRNGSYTMEHLTPGNYDFVACDTGKYGHAPRLGILLKEDQTRTLDFELPISTSHGGIQGYTQGPQGRILNAPIKVYLRHRKTGCEEGYTTANERGEYGFTGIAAPDEYDVYTNYSKISPQIIWVE